MSRVDRSMRARRRANSRSLLQCACEPLEMRTLFTSVLYLDFGDNFPAGGLTINQGTLRGGFGSSGLQGPDVRQPDDGTTAGVNEAITDATNFNLTGVAQFVTFDYNGDSATNGTDYTDLRTNVLTLAQRYYAPFDVNVQIAPAVGDLGTSADYINDVRTQLHGVDFQRPAATGSGAGELAMVIGPTRDRVPAQRRRGLDRPNDAHPMLDVDVCQRRIGIPQPETTQVA